VFEERLSSRYAVYQARAVFATTTDIVVGNKKSRNFIPNEHYCALAQ
jgi:hypothetical protein